MRTREFRRVQPRRDARGHRVWGQHRADMGRGNGATTRRAEARGRSELRRVEPRRDAGRHRVHGATARLWDAASGREIAVLRGHEGCLWSAGFSPDGTRVVTASGDKTARVWDAARGAKSPHSRGMRCSVAPPSARTGGSSSRRPLTTPRGSGTRLRGANSLRPRATAPVWFAAFNPDGTRVVTASGDNTARIWDAASGRELAALQGA